MELAELGPTLGLGVDVGDRDQVQAAAALTRAELGPVDALVNNAGVASSALPWEAEEESWRRHFRINADGTWWCIQACLPDMRERGYGKIVNIGSLSAQQGRPATDPAYPASKGAVLGLTVSLAHNLGADGICVNAINPGYIRTEIHDAFSEEQLATLAADVPLHRDGVKGGGRPIDIAERGAVPALGRVGLHHRRVSLCQRRIKHGLLSDGYRISVDIGGTFTDCTVVAPDGAVTIGKSPSTPPEFATGFVNSVRRRRRAHGPVPDRPPRPRPTASRTGPRSASTRSSRGPAPGSG